MRTGDSGWLMPAGAWEKMLAQLGNLHQAGRELAEARERAAKAEVEAQFLRERLSELRSERDQLRGLVEDFRQRLERPPQEPTRLRRWWPPDKSLLGYRRRPGSDQEPGG